MHRPARSFRVPALRALFMAPLLGALLVLTGATSGPAGADAGADADAAATTSSAPAAPSTTSSSAGAGKTVDPFTHVLDYLHSRRGVVQVALFNANTGKTSQISDGTSTQYSASVVKADILAMWLHRYQSDPGAIPDNIGSPVRFLMEQMIRASDNSAATGLLYFGGGCDALTKFNTLIPTRSTKVGCPTPTYYGWGNTETTAEDQVSVAKLYAYPNDVLSSEARAYGLSLMETVQPDQRFGITCGPWGTSCDAPDYAKPVPDITVAVKNGWKPLPTCTKSPDECPWQVNSIGWVHGAGRDYAVAILTTEDPAGPDLGGYHYGIDTIQHVSEQIWENLAPSRSP